MTSKRPPVPHGAIPESHRKTEFGTCMENVAPFVGGVRRCMQVRPCPVHEPGVVPGVAVKPAPEGLNPKDLIGASKPDVSLVPMSAILHEAQAMALGARKYGPGNWREAGKPVQARTYLAAAIRHIAAVLDGEDLDSESGGHHLGHARASLGIYLDAMECGQLIDNRLPAGPVPDVLARMAKSKTGA